MDLGSSQGGFDLGYFLAPEVRLLLCRESDDEVPIFRHNFERDALGDGWAYKSVLELEMEGTVCLSMSMWPCSSHASLSTK